MIDKRIKFDEAYYNEYHDEFTIYFTGPVDLLDRPEPCDVATEISLTFCPADEVTTENAVAEMSPTCQDDDGYLDYDWREITMFEDEISELLKLAQDAGVF